MIHAQLISGATGLSLVESERPSGPSNVVVVDRVHWMKHGLTE